MVEHGKEQNATAPSTLAQHASLEQVCSWLREVPDPEIPVISVVDLGIVRDLEWTGAEHDLLCVTVTPTFSGCPATEAIALAIREELASRGVRRVELKVQLSPPWTTDWMSEQAKKNLREYGIVPPERRIVPTVDGLAASLLVLGQEPIQQELRCPRCNSPETEMISLFGSTPCKSLHRCLACLEPFDHFKCH